MDLKDISELFFADCGKYEMEYEIIRALSPKKYYIHNNGVHYCEYCIEPPAMSMKIGGDGYD